MGISLDNLLESIKKVCEEYDLTFAQVICEAFFIFDDDFEEMGDDEVERGIREYGKKLEVGTDEL